MGFRDVYIKTLEWLEKSIDKWKESKKKTFICVIASLKRRSKQLKHIYTKLINEQFKNCEKKYKNNFQFMLRVGTDENDQKLIRIDHKCSKNDQNVYKIYQFHTLGSYQSPH
ncbi:hypothetical protein ACKWTF_006967 [Chironomus riparius]